MLVIGLNVVDLRLYVAIVDCRRSGGFQSFLNRIPSLVIVLRELGNESHASRYAQEIRIKVVPPFVRGTATSCDGCVDGKSCSADQRAYPADASEKLGHRICPTMLQKRPKIFH